MARRLSHRKLLTQERRHLTTTPKRDWKELCEAVSREQDPNRLMILISELEQALKERQSERHLNESAQARQTENA
jgi:hypothetical protein